MLEEVLHYKPWEYPPPLSYQRKTRFLSSRCHTEESTLVNKHLCAWQQNPSHFLLSHCCHAHNTHFFQIVTSQLWQRDDVTTKKQNTGRRAYPHSFSSLIVRPATIRLLADRIRMLADILIVFENTIRIFMKKHTLRVFPDRAKFQRILVEIA